ncbi:MAG: metallophosphoesterase [Candidatus Methanoplasma sp.]|jgi:putative SbcD/Mre11-related phosphoesterase|nr:metallophosphoesterase [Candidatus Methanoplasma sp.]
MDLQPIHGVPALMAGDCLIVTDLHIGLESHLRSKGFHIASRTEDMLESLIGAAGSEARSLIVLGDVKDSVPGSTKQEYGEIPVFFERLLNRFDEVGVVRGNHDTMIEDFLPDDVRVHPATGIRIGDVGLAHGHTWPSARVMSSETLVMGHDHPAVMLTDGAGGRSTEPCWVRGRFARESSDRYERLPKGFVIVPAFNRMLGGSPVNVEGEPLLGPVMGGDLLDIDGSRVHLLDGIDLGRVSDIRIGAPESGFRRRRVKK